LDDVDLNQKNQMDMGAKKIIQKTFKASLDDFEINFETQEWITCF
jgi:hypothetical protein